VVKNQANANNQKALLTNILAIGSVNTQKRRQMHAFRCKLQSTLMADSNYSTGEWRSVSRGVRYLEEHC